MALNVFESVKDYYKLVKSDLTRSGVVLKQVILECISGPAVREANQLSQLSEVFCARKKTVYEMSKMRLSMEENQKLVPLVQRLARKSPEGDKIITNEWKLKCVEFYETKSEIVKGHHSMYKVGSKFLRLFWHLQDLNHAGESKRRFWAE